jgi:flavin-dependent dehydrogenase
VSEDREKSVVLTVPVRRAAKSYDVAILGGGLAGLTLAIQLKRERPQTGVVVLEKREGPAPLAAFKVGESTLLSGAHYFAHVVGLLDHLEQKQFLKNGLRFLLPTDDNADITKRAEFGPISFPDRDTYQLDRGSLENELAARARALGVDLIQGARVSDVSLGQDLHTVNFTHADTAASTGARWVVDAAGRASLLKRQLGLARDVEHTINAAWVRLGGGLDFEQWGAQDADWMARMTKPGIRMFSTNHLLGEGYWVWLIPLSSGPISIGVCADPQFHSMDEINDLDRWIDWLSRHEPQLAAAIRPRMNQIEDFLRVEDFAYGVDRAYSTDRWCLVGEAAAFADPFYSPGSDFIGYGNSFACDLITRDLNGEEIADRLEYYNDFYHRTFEFVLSRTEHNYPLFGNPWVMAGKLGWDVYHIHTGVTVLMVKSKLTDLDYMRSVDADVDRLYRLSINMQKVFRQWHAIERRPRENTMLLPIRARVPGFPSFLEELSDDQLRESLQEQVRYAEAIAVAIFGRAASALEQPPAPDRPLDPYALDLQSRGFQMDGGDPERSISIADARALLPGLDGLWERVAPPPGMRPPGAAPAPAGRSEAHPAER